MSSDYFCCFLCLCIRFYFCLRASWLHPAMLRLQLLPPPKVAFLPILDVSVMQRSLQYTSP